MHFGSRGLGHTSATRYLKAAGGKDGMNVPPAVIDEDSEIGRRYIAAMQLAGRYSYAGREWVIERVRQIIGGAVTDMVHNHHNYAWRENHDGRDLWVVRKGATPAFPGQRGFVGGSMGDDAVIIEGVDSEEAQRLALLDGARRRPAVRPQGSQAPVHPRRDGRMAAAARRYADRGRPRRKPDGLSPAAGGARRARRLDQGAAHAAAVRGRDGGRGRVRSVQGLTSSTYPFSRSGGGRESTPASLNSGFPEGWLRSIPIATLPGSKLAAQAKTHFPLWLFVTAAPSTGCGPSSQADRHPLQREPVGNRVLGKTQKSAV